MIALSDCELLLWPPVLTGFCIGISLGLGFWAATFIGRLVERHTRPQWEIK